MVRYFEGHSPMDSLHKLTRHQIWENYSALNHTTPVGSHYSFLRHSAIVHREKLKNKHVKNVAKQFPSRNSYPWSIDTKFLDVSSVSTSTSTSGQPSEQTPALYIHVYLCGNAQLALSWITSAQRSLMTPSTIPKSSSHDIHAGANHTTLSLASGAQGPLHRATLLVDHPGYGVNEGLNADITRDSIANHVVSAIEASILQLAVKYAQSGVVFPSKIGIEFIGYSIGTAASLESGRYIHMRTVDLSHIPSSPYIPSSSTLFVTQYQLIAPPTSLSAVAATLPIVFAPEWLIKLVWPTDFDSLTRAKEISDFNTKITKFANEKLSENIENVTEKHAPAELARYGIQTFVYHGDQDTLVPMRMGQELADALKTQLVVLPSHNHVSIVGDDKLEVEMGLFRIPSANAAVLWFQRNHLPCESDYIHFHETFNKQDIDLL